MAIPALFVVEANYTPKKLTTLALQILAFTGTIVDDNSFSP